MWLAAWLALVGVRWLLPGAPPDPTPSASLLRCRQVLQNRSPLKVIHDLFHGLSLPPAAKASGTSGCV